MNQKLRVLLFGTLLLGAFLLAGSLSSHVFAATTVASATSSGPSFARPTPNWSYNDGFRNGYAAGYRAGIRACDNHHYEEGSQAPDRAFHLSA
ncbi:MAG TPA: hypothetical protein VGU68_01250, partial [Ktedonobacteraceae bacterium]|nr:hypothetical protein [Ktedonobacteraceae bacterium]